MAMPFNGEKFVLCTLTDFPVALWTFRVLEVKGRPGTTVLAGFPCLCERPAGAGVQMGDAVRSAGLLAAAAGSPLSLGLVHVQGKQDEGAGRGRSSRQGGMVRGNAWGNRRRRTQMLM